jgi:hypothetical protein
VSLMLIIFTVSSLEVLVLSWLLVGGYLLARNSNPVPVWTQGYVSDGQRRSVDYFFELVAFKCVFADCSVLGSSDEEAILHSGSVISLIHGTLHVRLLQQPCCLLGNCPRL